MNQAIQDRIGDRRIREAGVPLGYGYLSGDQHRGSVITIVQNFEQLLRLRPGQRIAEPIVKDQELDMGKVVEELGVGAVGVGQGDVVQESGSALVADMEVVATAGVGEGGGQESFARAGRAKDKDIEMLADPLALGQLENKATVQTARGSEVEVFDGR